jgi:hypothetical protein
MQDMDAILDVAALDEEIVPAGAMVETKQDAVHYITVLVLGLTPPA